MKKVLPPGSARDDLAIPDSHVPFSLLLSTGNQRNPTTWEKLVEKVPGNASAQGSKDPKDFWTARAKH